MPRRVLEGRVVSDKQSKTVTVLVERRVMHPIYKKFVKQTKKYAAHDEGNAFSEGDWVEIQECRPISKKKKWTVITQPAPDAKRAARAAGTIAGEAVDTGKKPTAKNTKKSAAKKTTKAKKK